MVAKLSRTQIDAAAWDRLVEESVAYNPNAYSWYLDEVSPGWAAWVDQEEDTGRYLAALPVPYVRKWGIRYVRQSPFCFQLGLMQVQPQYPVDRLLAPFLEGERFISEYYFDRILDPARIGTHTSIGLCANYVLNLQQANHQQYNQNRRRELKKFQESGVQLLAGAAPEVLLDLFYTHTSGKIYGIRREQYASMQRVAQLYQEKLQFFSLVISRQQQPIGAAWILGGKRRAFYLMASYAPSAYEIGGATGLIHGFIERWGSGYDTLSFNGSEEEGVARFYKSFGAQAVPFSSIRHVKLPTAVKTVLRLRTSIIQSLRRK
jgi:hypothetical protein